MVRDKVDDKWKCKFNHGNFVDRRIVSIENIVFF